MLLLHAGANQGCVNRALGWLSVGNNLQVMACFGFALVQLMTSALPATRAPDALPPLACGHSLGNCNKPSRCNHATCCPPFSTLLLTRTPNRLSHLDDTFHSQNAARSSGAIPCLPSRCPFGRKRSLVVRTSAQLSHEATCSLPRRTLLPTHERIALLHLATFSPSPCTLLPFPRISRPPFPALVTFEVQMPSGNVELSLQRPDLQHPLSLHVSTPFAAAASRPGAIRQR